MSIVGYFDAIHGASLFGWAFDQSNLSERLLVEAVMEDGQVFGCSRANVFRGDLLKAGVGDGRHSFRIDLSGNIIDFVDKSVGVRIAGSECEFLAGSFRKITLNQNLRYLISRRKRAAPILKSLRARLDREAGDEAISIIMPVFNTRGEWLIEAIESVLSQWCGHWELICIDDGSTDSRILPILREFVRIDKRVRLISSPVNVGIARAVNFGLRAAKYNYVAFFDHDDVLEPHAIWRLIRAAHKSNADLIYSDEVVTTESIDHIIDVRSRPAFSYDYYLSHPYFVHLLCVKKDLAQIINGWDENMPISADVDFVLRVLERAHIVAHEPSVLYRWRTHGSSAGHTKQQEVTVAATAAIQEHLKRTGSKAIVSSGTSFNQYHVSWPVPDERVLIILPTKNGGRLLRKCIRSIEKTVSDKSYRLIVIDHQSDDQRTIRYLEKTVRKKHTVMSYEGKFNFSRMNNLAVQEYGEGFKFLLFINDDVEAVQDGWLERLVSLANRPDVGVVGPLLLFPDGRIQHAGVIVGFCEAAEHVGKFAANEDGRGMRNLGANSTFTSVRDFSAVTAACLVMRQSVFNEVNGFCEDFPVAFNDTDLCLRVRDNGYRALYDGHTTLYHHESATRAMTNDLNHPEDTKLFQKKWKHLMGGADPFYNPALSLNVQDHVLAEQLVVDRAVVRIIDTSAIREQV